LGGHFVYAWLPQGSGLFGEILSVAADASARVSTRMKIGILDAGTANPGDLDCSFFKAIGECSIHDRTPTEQTIERCAASFAGRWRGEELVETGE
jgi:hypothetical protein